MSTKQLSLFDTSKFNVKRLPDLQAVLDCLDSIPYINQGGCGISALAIYRWCKKNGIEVNDRPFVVLCEDEWELSYNNGCIEEGNWQEIGIPHVVIELNGTLWDSTGDEYYGEGLIREYTNYRQEYQLSEDELLYIINNPGWNSSFNRERNLPLIEYGLEVDLSDVEVW